MMNRQRASFTPAEINAVARASKATGVRLALLARPDGTKVVVPAGEGDAGDVADDLTRRLEAFAAS